MVTGTQDKKIPAGFKQTEVGLIPSDWENERICELALITTGKRNTQDKVDDGAFPFFVRSQRVERINSYCFDGEAVLTAGDGVGTGKVFHYINGKFDFHQRVYKISDFRREIDGFYFYLYFSNHFYDRIMSMTAKSSVDSVRLEMIADMQIPVPPMPEQSAVAEVFSHANALIEGLEKLIAKRRVITQGAMQELLTGKRRLPGFSGEWEVKKLWQIGKTYGGLSGKIKSDFSTGNSFYIPFMNIMSNPVIDPNYLDSVHIRADESQNKTQRGDLFFNGSSETPEEVGMCAVLKDDIPNLYLNSFCFGFRLSPELKTDGLFFAYFFRSSIGRRLIYSLAQGATRYNLSKTNFLKLEVLYPNPKEQSAIAAVISDMDAEIESLEQKLSKYKLIKTGMMQQLLTGKIRLI